MSILLKQSFFKYLLFISFLAQGIITVLFLNTETIKYNDIKLLTINLILFSISILAIKNLNISKKSFAVILVLGAVFLHICAMSSPPSTSDDDFRYYWDGKVQVNAINPYRYSPADEKVAYLRDDFIFSRKKPCPEHRIKPRECSKINRPTVNTIYPPASQATFTALYLTTFITGKSHLPYQVAGAIGVLIISFLIAKRLAVNGSSLWASAVFAWCPITYIELVNNAHIDWLGIIFALLALSACASKKYIRCGIFIGIAFASKFYPAVISPSLISKKPLRVILSAILTVAVSYLGYVLSIGTKVLGFLPGYLEEEKYSNGERFLLLSRIFTTHQSTYIALLVLVIVSIYAMFKTDPSFPENSALLLLVCVTLISTPAQGWYSLLLLSLIAITKKFFILPIVFVSSYVYLAQQSFGTQRGIAYNLYIWAVIITLALWGAGSYRKKKEHHVNLEIAQV